MADWMKFPGPKREAPKPPEVIIAPEREPFWIKLKATDFIDLIESAECDDTKVKCEECGALLRYEDAFTDSFVGCWYMATGDEREKKTCRREFGEAIQAARQHLK